MAMLRLVLLIPDANKDIRLDIVRSGKVLCLPDNHAERTRLAVSIKRSRRRERGRTSFSIVDGLRDDASRRVRSLVRRIRTAAVAPLEDAGDTVEDALTGASSYLP